MENLECLKIPGYEFWIEIAGKRAKQFQLEENDEGVSCYIASEVNQEFSIITRKHRDGLGTFATFYLNDDCFRRFLYKPNDTVKFEVSRTSTDSGAQKFAFSAITYGEDESCELTTIPKNLGTIRIELFRVINVRRVRRRPKGGSSRSNRLETASLGTPTMSEKSKTVGFHTISLQPSKTPLPPVQPRDFKDAYDFVDSLNPWRTIKFFYRPLDTLQALGIAPRPPIPIDVGNEKDSNQASDPRNISGQAQETALTSPRKMKAETLGPDTPKTIKSEEIIVIEDSDAEDHKPKLSMRLKRLRQSACGNDMRPEGKKRIKKASDPDVIIIDSD